MVKVKIIVYGSLIVAGLGFIAYLVYALRKPVQKIIDMVTGTIEGMGAYVGTMNALRNVGIECGEERTEITNSMTDSPKINSFYINGWYNKWHLFYTGLLRLNEYVKANPFAIAFCERALNYLDSSRKWFFNLYVPLPLDIETPLPPVSEWPEMLKEIEEGRILMHSYPLFMIPPF